MRYKEGSEKKKTYPVSGRNYEAKVEFNSCDYLGWIVIDANAGSNEARVVAVTLQRLGQIYRDAVKAYERIAKKSKKKGPTR